MSKFLKYVPSSSDSNFVSVAIEKSANGMNIDTYIGTVFISPSPDMIDRIMVLFVKLSNHRTMLKTYQAN